MKSLRRLVRGTPAVLAALLFNSHAWGESSTWTGSGLDGLWTNASNWGTAGVPGGTTVITGTDTGNADVVTFNYNLNPVITLDAYRNVTSLVFAPGVDAYTIQEGTLALSSGGSVVVKGGVTLPQTIASPVLLVPAAATAVFSSDSVVEGANLNFTGGITGQRTTGITSITLDGIGEGVISSVISNGSGGGKVSILKRSGGNWTLSGANTFSGGITAYNGNLVFDYATQTSLAAASTPLTMAGGTLIIKGRSTGTTTQTLGDLTLASNRGAGVLVVDKNGGAGTTLTLGNTWTRNFGSVLLFDLSSGGVVASSPSMTNSVVIGATPSVAAAFIVKDTTGKTDYATRNASNQIVRLETNATAAVTTYAAGSALADTAKNYKINTDTALTSGTNTFGTLRIDASVNPVTVNLGLNDLLLGKSTMLVDGSNAVRLESSGGKLATGGFIVMNYNTATTTIAARLGVAVPSTVNFCGPGTTVLDFDNSGQTGGIVMQGSVVRLAQASALVAGNVAIQNGGVLELGAADFTRSMGINGGQVQFNSGSGGFSAFGAPRTVNLGNAALTWSSGSFLLDGSILVLGSRTSDNTVTFANAINLADGNRVIQVNDGVSTTDVDAILSGVISSSNPAAGILTKRGPGTLALSGANTYEGGTNILGGQLIVGTGATGSLAATGVIYNEGILSFNRTGFYTCGGAITGPGTVKQIGAGKTIYAGLNTYTGPTEVINGTLAGSGAGVSDVTIHAATLAPGVNAGTFYAASATFNPESTFEVEIDGSSADKLQATGAITLAGALNVIPRFGGFTQPSYVIAEGGSLSGKFSSVTYGYKVTYTATQAILSEVPTYYTWSDYWAPGQSEHQDYDGDGVSNGLEYFMGETTSAVTLVPSLVNMDGVLSVTWPKGSAYYGEYGVDYIVQTSTNLLPEGQPGGWAPAPAGTVIDTASALTCIFPANEPRYFARLKVVIPPDPIIPIVPPSKAPPTPKGFEITANSASSITMTWYRSPSNDDDASEFHVFSSTTQSGTFTKIGTTIERKFVHTGLAANTTRYYKVSAANVAGESAQSSAAPGFTIIPSDGSSLPVLIAKNMCVSMGQTVLSNVAPSSGTLSKLVDGLDSTSCTIVGACEVKIKLNPAISIEDAPYLMLNFRTDTESNGTMAYNEEDRALRNYVILQSTNSTNGTDGTWTEVVSGTNPYLDGVVVIPTPNGSPKPKWIAVRNSATLQLCRLEIFRAAPAGYRNDYWIFVGDSLVVGDLAGGTASAHSVWFSDLVRQRHPDRYPIMVKSAQGGEVIKNSLGRMANSLPIHSADNGTATPTGTFLCLETGFNDVGDGGGLWQGPGFITQLSEVKTLIDSHGMFLVPVRIEFSTHGLNLDTLEPVGSLRRHTLGANLAGVDVFARANTPYAVDPATQLPYADYWTYTRNNYATVLASDGVHHTRTGCDGINTLWADVADKMIYLKQP